jgi:lipopolysaccharide/colanic/teichoic acid biosynthesis glycosyltransferase
VWREVALYDPRALRRLEVRPGLTCLWQISGRSDLSFEQQVDLDIQYIDTTQPADEVKILVRTIPAVLSGKGAY